MLGQILGNPEIATELGQVALLALAALAAITLSFLTMGMGMRRPPHNRANHPIGLIKTGPPKM